MPAKNPPETSLKPKGGRPAKGTWTEDRLLEICARVALGETLTTITTEPGQPTAPQFRAAVMRSPTLRDAWETAKLERPHALFEEAIDMARQLRETAWDKDDTNNVRSLQIAIDALRTAAGRLSPREYGERPAAQIVVPVQINTTLSLDATRGPTLKPSVYQIDAGLPALPGPSE